MELLKFSHDFFSPIVVIQKLDPSCHINKMTVGNNKHVLSDTLSEGQEFRIYMARWCQFRISWGFSPAMGGQAAVISKFDWGWRICIQAHSHVCWLETLISHWLLSRASFSFCIGFSIGTVSSSHSSWLSPEAVIPEGEPNAEAIAYNLISEVTTCSVGHTDQT